VLILTIIIMVTISIRPYTPRKIWLVIAGFIYLASLSCFAQTAYVDVNSTPYDRQMACIRSILISKAKADKQDLSLGVVNHWIEDLRAIPYSFSMEWKMPAEVESGAVADCKGKAVALYDMMHSRGAENVRLVIGKRMSTSRRTHAWLEWSTADGTYVLDPTINWAACRAERLGNGSYIPLYAYVGTRKFRAATATLYAKSQSSAGQRVASDL